MGIAHGPLGCMVVLVQTALEIPSGASPLLVSLSVTAMEDKSSRVAQLRGN